MDRAAYNTCIRPHITGSKTKEQRQLDFCVGAKLCSHKAQDRGEAERICKLPKEPKAAPMPKKRKGEEENCDPNQFFDVAGRFKNIYIAVQGSHCAPCVELDRKIREVKIPHEIVYVPQDCIEILNKLGVRAFPTVVKMSNGKVVSQHVGSPSEIIESMRRGD